MKRLVRWLDPRLQRHHITDRNEHGPPSANARYAGIYPLKDFDEKAMRRDPNIIRMFPSIPLNLGPYVSSVNPKNSADIYQRLMKLIKLRKSGRRHLHLSLMRPRKTSEPALALVEDNWRTKSMADGIPLQMRHCRGGHPSELFVSLA